MTIVNLAGQRVERDLPFLSEVDIPKIVESPLLTRNEKIKILYKYTGLSFTTLGLMFNLNRGTVCRIFHDTPRRRRLYDIS